MISIEALHPTIGAAVHGVNLAAVSAEDFDVVSQALRKHAVLVFHDQQLSDEDQLRFSRMFGPLQLRGTYSRVRERTSSEYLADISNIDPDGKLLRADDRQRKMNLADRLWHTDGTFMHVPSVISLLYAHEVAPEGGNTEFADMRAAYDALPDEDKATYERWVLEHDLFRSRSQVGFDEFNPEVRALRPPVRQVMVRQHEETGRRSLYLASHVSHVIGRDVQEGRALIERLIAFATQPQFVFAHRWSAGDLVMWDNRCTMHRARPFDDQKYRRVMQRSTVMDTLNSVERACAMGRSFDLGEAVDPA